MSEQNTSHLDTTPLYAMNPVDRFSDRVGDYVKYRPSYPQAAIERVLEGLSPSQTIAADIGAGTGIAARLLAEKGVRVIAIEPNVPMRQAAAPHALVEFRDGTAETTGLADAAVDLVTCFQSFHWFDPEPTLLEFRRILTEEGRLAVVWNERDRHDEFTAEYTHLIKVASGYHPAEQRRMAIEPLLRSSLFADVQQYRFAYQQPLDFDGVVGRAMSTSYIPRTGAAYERLIADLRQLYAKNCNDNGFVTLVYTTSVFLTQTR
ncbi:MAG: putative methyltransferase [Chroococcidiopsis sp. SAG 2025]|uniref:class I SAM-dependent methyltransferase n=1 Tax=Chroococcidiopsis sp. SAG 2025 TaxID=171389 RepID=UPI002937267B|nr:class I SAM-dependent methyltransferase [Chroococcidiopsis sp. SAG 2025]MDV2996473.1 putative methyltransferase [Chroococcidiopsis sp. SAG 2025]